MPDTAMAMLETTSQACQHRFTFVAGPIALPGAL